MYYCPKCAAQNADDAKYCRSCGANVSLVPQALTGRLPEAWPDALKAEGEVQNRSGRRRRSKEPPSLEKGLQNIFIGVAFLIIFLAGLLFFRSGFMIWIWFIIPALACMGEGIGQFMRAKHEQPALTPPLKAAAVKPPPPLVSELPARTTSEILQPPLSVTEGTTRHLDAESSKRYFDPLNRPADKV